MKPLNGTCIENPKNLLVASAPRSLELAQRSPIGDKILQNFLKSASLDDPELERAYGFGPPRHDVAVVREWDVHHGATLGQDGLVGVAFDLPVDDVVAGRLAGHVGVAREVHELRLALALRLVGQELGASLHHYLEVFLGVLVYVHRQN